MDDWRGQAGLDRLLLFLIGIVVLLAVLPPALGVLGLADGSVSVAGAGDAGGPGELVVLGASGSALDGDSVGRVDLAVTAVGGPVDLSAVSVTVLGSDPVTLLPAGDGDGAGATLGVEAEDGTLDPGERATLTVDLGSDDVDGVGEVGTRLEAGTSRTLVVNGPNSSREVTLSAPGSLPGSGEVSL